MDLPRTTAACLCVGFLAFAQPLSAEEERAEPASPRAASALIHTVGASALLRALDTHDLGLGGQLDYRLRWPSEYQLGLSFAALALAADRIGGFAAEDTVRYELGALSAIPLGRTGPLLLDLRVTLGYAELHSAQADLEQDRGRRLGLELAVIGNIVVAPPVSVRLGFSSPVAFEIAPTGELATQGALILLGVGGALSSSLFLRGDVETGGVFGFDGDGTKYETRASLNLRWVSGQLARSSHAL
jgi:hypothetical protein